jgi:predicted DNA-binding ribbon-helix-helix protein
VGAIDSGRAQGNLSSALRLFVLDHYRTQIGSEADARTLPHASVEQDDGKPLSYAAVSGVR